MRTNSSGSFKRIMSALLTLCMIVSVLPGVALFSADAAATALYYDFTVANTTGTMTTDTVKTITYDVVSATGATTEPWAFNAFTSNSTAANTYFMYASSGVGFYFGNGERDKTSTASLKFKVSTAGTYLPMLNIKGVANWSDSGFAMVSIKSADGATTYATKAINFADYTAAGHYVSLSDTGIELAENGEYIVEFYTDKVKGKGIIDGLKLVPVEDATAAKLVIDHNSGLVSVNMGETASVPLEVTMASGTADLSKVTFEYSAADIATAEIDGNNIKVTPVAVGTTTLTVKYGDAMARTNIKVNAEGTTVAPNDLIYNFQANMPSAVESVVNLYYTHSMANSTEGAYGDAYNTSHTSQPYGIESRQDSSNVEQESFYFSRLYQSYGYLHNTNGTVTMRIRVPVDGKYTASAYVHAADKAETISFWKPGQNTYLAYGVAAQGVTGAVDLVTTPMELTAGDYLVKFNKTSSGSNIFNSLTLKYEGKLDGAEPVITLVSGGDVSTMVGNDASTATVKLTKDGENVALDDALITAFTATSKSDAIATAEVNADRTIKVTPVAEGNTTIDVALTYDGKEYTTSIAVAVAAKPAEDVIELTNGGSVTAVIGTDKTATVTLTKNGQAVDLSDALITAFTATSASDAIATATVNADRSIKVTPVAKGNTTVEVALTYNGKDYTTTINVVVEEPFVIDPCYFDFKVAATSASAAGTDYFKSITYDTVAATGKSAPWAFGSFTGNGTLSGNTYFMYVGANSSVYFGNAERNKTLAGTIKFKTTDAGSFIPMINLAGSNKWSDAGFAVVSVKSADGTTTLASKPINMASIGGKNHFVALSDTPVAFAANSEYLLVVESNLIKSKFVFDGLKLAKVSENTASGMVIDHNSGLIEVNMGETKSVPLDVTMATGTADLSKVTFEYSAADIAAATIDGTNIKVTPIAEGTTTLTVRYGDAMARTNIKVNAAGTTVTARDLYYNFLDCMPDYVQSEVNHVYSGTFHMSNTTEGAYGQAGNTQQTSDPWGMEARYNASGDPADIYFSRLYSTYGFLHYDKGTAVIRIRVPADGKYNVSANLQSATAASETISLWKPGENTYMTYGVINASTAAGKQAILDTPVSLTAGDYLLKFNKTSAGSNIFNGIYLDFAGPLEGGEDVIALTGTTYSDTEGNAAKNVSVTLKKNGLNVALTDEKVTAMTATSKSSAVATATVNADRTIAITPVGAGNTTIDVKVTFEGNDYTTTIAVTVNAKPSTASGLYYDFKVANTAGSHNNAYIQGLTYDAIAGFGGSQPWAFDSYTTTGGSSGNTYFIYAARNVGFYFANGVRNTETIGSVKIKVPEAGSYIPMVEIHGMSGWGEVGFVEFSLNSLDGKTTYASRGVNGASYNTTTFVPLTTTPVALEANGEYQLKFAMEKLNGKFIFDGFKLVPVKENTPAEIIIDHNSGYAEVALGNTVNVPVEVKMASGNADLSKMTFTYSKSGVATAATENGAIKVTPVAEGTVTITAKYGEAMASFNVKVQPTGYVKTPTDLTYDFMKSMPSAVQSEVNLLYSKNMLLQHSTTGAYGEVYNPGHESSPWGIEGCYNTAGQIDPKFYFARVYSDYGFIHNSTGTAVVRIRVPVDGYYLPTVLLNSAAATSETISIWKVGANEYLSSKSFTQGTEAGEVDIADGNIALTAGDYLVKFNKTTAGNNTFNRLTLYYRGPLSGEAFVELTAGDYAGLAGGASTNVPVTLKRNGEAVNLTDSKVTAMTATSNATSVATVEVNADRTIKVTPIAVGTTTIDVKVTYDGKDYTTTIPVEVSAANAKDSYEYDFKKLIKGSKSFYTFTALTDFSYTTMGHANEIHKGTSYCDYTDPFIFVKTENDAKFAITDSTYAAMLDGGIGAAVTLKVRVGQGGVYSLTTHHGMYNGGALVDIYFAPDGVTNTMQPQYYVGQLDTYKADYQLQDWNTRTHIRNITVPAAGDYQVTYRLAGKNPSGIAMRFPIGGILLLPSQGDEAVMTLGELDRVMVSETATVPMGIAVNSIAKDFSIASDITVASSEDGIVEASINRTNDNKDASLTVKGLAAGQTVLTITATVDGKPVKLTRTVKVVAPSDKSEEIFIDFTKKQDIPILEKTIAEHGWAINKTMTPAAIYSPANSKHFRYQAYGIAGNYQNSANTEFNSDITFDVDVLAAGAYELRVNGGKYTSGAKVAVYVDKQYVGEYDFYGTENIASQGEKQLNTVNLGVGVHQITFRRISTETAQALLCLGSIRLTPVAEMPEFIGFVAEADETELVVGEKVSAIIGPKTSDGSPYYFGKLFAGNADDTQNSYKFTNSDSSVVSYEDGVLTALKAGTAKLSVAGVKDGTPTNKDITITVVNDPLASVEANFKASINNGEQVMIEVVAKTEGGRVINPLSYEPEFTSSNTSAVIVRDGVIFGVGRGESTITTSVTFNGITKTTSGDVAIANDGIKIYAYADRTALAPTDTQGTQVRVADSSLNLINNGVTYKSTNEKVIKVDANGKVVPVAVGRASVNVTASYKGTTYNLTVPFNITEGKSAASYYTGTRVEALRENRKNYDWALDTSVATIKRADWLIENVPDFYSLVTTQELPRSATVGFRWDPNNYHCRYCGIDLANSSWGSYGWMLDPINKPYKVTCPDCRKAFPTNDFEKFYQLGIAEDGKWSYELAKEENAKLVAAGQPGYLVNESLPEKGADWGVDDGYGYRTGKTITNSKGEAVEEVHTYMSYYNHWGVWYHGYGGENAGIVQQSVSTLFDAYLNTGDIKYGKPAAILIDRIADVYPDMYIEPYFPQFFNSDSTMPKGKMVGCIWQHGMSRAFVQGYDAVYDVFDHPLVIEEINANALKYNAGVDKSSAVAIRDHIEKNLILQTYVDIRNGNIHGNFGMHQSLAAYTAVIYDTMPKTKEILDWMYASTADTFGADDIGGGNVSAQLINLVDRDGLGAESGANYNVLWANSLLNIFGPTEGYTKYADADGFSNPRVQKMFKAYLPLTLIRRSTVPIGDSGAVAKAGFDMTSTLLAKGFMATGDVEMAQFLYHMYKGNLMNLHADKWTKNPEEIQGLVQAVIKEHGEYDFDRSHLLSGYGFGILRDGTLREAANDADTIDTQSDMWMYFGGANSHKHMDVLNLGMEAFGATIIPDLGYPTTADGSDRTINWEMGTANHVTVMVNEKQHNRNRSYNNGVARNSGRPAHFDDSGRVKVLDVVAPTNATDSQLFRRSIVYVKVDAENFYGVDFFRVGNGLSQIYQFHAYSNSIHETEGLTLTAQNGGSYAGESIEFGTQGISNGHSYLYNVRKSPSATGNFAVDFKIQNFRGESWGKDNIHLRTTMVNDFALDHVAIAKGNPPSRDGNPEQLEFVMAKRTGTGLDSLWTAVYEPYKGQRYVEKIESVPVTYADGSALSATDAKQTKAVKVTREGGVVDYIVYNTSNASLKVDSKFDFQGFIGVYTLKDGEFVYSYGQDTSKIGDATSTAAYTGKVTDFTRELSTKNYITIKFDSAIDASNAVGRMIDVTNGRTENGNVILGNVLEDLGNNEYKFDIGDQSLVTAVADPTDMKAGYLYNAAVNNAVRIPLPTVVGAGPKFQKINNMTGEAGAEVKFTARAEAAEGKTLTYELIKGPSGSNLNPETGEFTWIPSNSHRGDNVIAIQVSDGVLTDTLYVTVTVFSGTNPTPSPGPGGGGGGENSKLTVKFETNGGSNVAQQAVAKGGTVKEPTAPTKEGYTFDGWYTDAELTTKFDFATTVSTEMTLYAKWVVGETTERRFIDLGNHKWAEDAIYRLVDAGVVNGTSYNTYSPGVNITRADFTTLIVRAFKFEAEVATFADVDASKYYAEPIGIAKTLGIVNGINATDFAPTAQITRQDMMVIIYRALGVAGIKLEKTVDATFPDADTVSAYAKDAVDALIGSGLIAGSNGKINPKANTTRAEVAVVLDRILNK